MRERYWTIVVLIVLFGLWSAATAFDESMGRALATIGFLEFPEPALTSAGQLGFAIAGGVMVGWGVMILALVRAGVARTILSKALRMSAIGWFAVDSIGSVLVGAYGNVALNCVFIALVFWATAEASAATLRSRAAA